MYRGPFLDGLYLRETPEFELWLKTERADLASAYAGALERLARAASAASDRDACVTTTEASPARTAQGTVVRDVSLRSGSEDIVEPFDDAREFLCGDPRQAATDAFGSQRPNLADLHP